jgi:hypothetical protein
MVYYLTLWKEKGNFYIFNIIIKRKENKNSRKKSIKNLILLNFKKN